MILNMSLLERELQRLAYEPLQIMAAEGAQDLREKISAGPRSGNPGPVRQASAPGEYPQEQYGELLASVDHFPNANNSGQNIGFIAAPPYAFALEGMVPSRGARYPLRMWKLDKKAHKRMLKKVGGR